MCRVIMNIKSACWNKQSFSDRIYLSVLSAVGDDDYYISRSVFNFSSVLCTRKIKTECI
jgi:hypothetical protein